MICGYRNPSSNEFLRARSPGVAKNSQHMQAHAIDIRIPGINTLTLYNASIALGRGGVGYYPRSAFVHVDTGRVRTWCYGCSSSHTNAEKLPEAETNRGPLQFFDAKACSKSFPIALSYP